MVGGVPGIVPGRQWEGGPSALWLGFLPLPNTHTHTHTHTHPNTNLALALQEKECIGQ